MFCLLTCHRISPADDLILRDILPEPLITFSQANSITNRVITDFQKRAYNIAAFLSPFFTEVQYYSFWGLQAITGLLISRSTALQFLDHTYYKGSDLDLYVNHVFARRVCFLFFCCAFCLDRSFLDLQTTLAELNAPMPTPLPKQYGGPGIICVLKYRNPSNMKVDVILTRFTPLQAILSFHSTCVMNVISYAHAISLYPRATFVDHVACHIESGRMRDMNAISKYKA
ncbi:uncharacterized protein EV420DRAFT_1273743 [Desarmillaria tabescens]|uniref:Uncharacterized protein n=1 Tax=Armillaria tabescens TaxID=1929756 RepID=A0AA39N0C3_ARMTA|nr:uncharacterized protein EV420DRAFT_1273743 [Desarmillaria tabescens]KAK0452808.1 hypothetical protein EV420DRAFT_1273743 [Desarmillaria tabescens]